MNIIYNDIDKVIEIRNVPKQVYIDNNGWKYFESIPLLEIEPYPESHHVD